MNQAAFKSTVKRWLARTLWAYGPDKLIRQLRQIGVTEGSTLVVHSSWLPHNGFRGKPADLVKALKAAVGESGLLVMTSLPYQNMSSAQWLASGKPMNVRRSPSMMGLVSEVFRRSEGVRRSLSATHPLLAWGRDAERFVEGHENTDRPFGAGSPFARILERDAIVLGFDAPFSTFTFHMYVEDQFADRLPVPLYEPELHSGKVIDYAGTERAEHPRALGPRQPPPAPRPDRRQARAERRPGAGQAGQHPAGVDTRKGNAAGREGARRQRPAFLRHTGKPPPA
jgi:aminoglycoside 3-N-acetyltransferase